MDELEFLDLLEGFLEFEEVRPVESIEAMDEFDKMLEGVLEEEEEWDEDGEW